MRNILYILLLISLKTWAQESVLSEGEWIKISVSKSGIYKIDKAFLDKHAPHFSKVSPGILKIYGGHSGELPQLNSAASTKGLVELPVHLKDENNSWDGDDFIAFYARDPHHVFFSEEKWQHSINPYSDQNFFYISVDGSPSKRITSYSNPKENSNIETDLPYYHYEEQELYNLLSSGRLWVGPRFNSNYSLTPVTTDFRSDYLLSYEVLPLGRAIQYLTTVTGTVELKKDTLAGSLYSSNDNSARYNRISNFFAKAFKSQEPFQNIELRLSSESIGNVGVHLNYWSVSYNRLVKYSEGEQIVFRKSASSKTARIQASNFSANTLIWQVKDAFSVNSLTINDKNVFSLDTGESEIIVFDEKSIKTPLFIGKVMNKSLKYSSVPEVLVVFPESFRKESERLIDFKRKTEGYEIAGFSTEEIYNQYSSGKVDPTAIRNFCRDLYSKGQGIFKHLLLLGDASYDYKNNNKASFVNTALLVPSYQSRESLEPIYSYASDDFFGFLDAAEGLWPEGYSINNRWVSTRDNSHKMDIAVGRIPAKTVLELTNYINKYINYKSIIETAPWQNHFGFVADNRDYNLHQRDAENLENLALNTFSGLKTDKLYLDDFPIKNENSNYSSPEANTKLHEMVNKGTFLMTYIGHGAEDGFTNEKLLTLADILSFKNQNKLPIWLTATCQFGKFDNPAVVSGAELSLLRPDGGSIALLTTTRPVYSSTNQLVNQAFFKNFNTAETLGELFKITKNESVSGEINRNFSLLGDPSLKLPNWKPCVNITLEKDTLHALNPVKFTGFNENIESGNVLIHVIDKPFTKNTLGSFEDGPKFTYQLNSQEIFLGRFPINGHNFNGEIRLPVQQVKGSGNGRLVLTFIDKDSTFSEFSTKNPIRISSDIITQTIDKSPPKLTATLDNNLTLVWNISDDSGINISNFDSLAALRLFINEKEIPGVISYFDPLDGARIARISYYVGALTNGSHTTQLIASDIHNNIAKETFAFQINRPKVEIIEAMVFPNPVTDYLNFRIKHNKPGDDLLLKLTVVNTLGEILWYEENECRFCAETTVFSTDFYGKTFNFPKAYYSLELKSGSENHVAQLSGSLFFWK